MKFEPPITIHAQVETPLFIWDGEVLSPLSFVTDNSRAYVIDGDRLIQAFSARGQEAYLAWIDPQLSHLAELDTRLAQVGGDQELRRQLNRDKRDAASQLSVERFIRDLLHRDPATFVQMSKTVAYAMRWNVRPGGDGFRGFTKAAGYRPYVPGTELKGAWRTALLYALTREAQNYAVLKNELVEFRRVFQSGEPPWRKVQRLSQIADQVESGALRGTTKNDAKYDLLRLLHIGDGDMMSSDVLRIRALESVGTNRFTRTLAEAVEPGTTFSFRLSLASIGEVKWALQELGLVHLAGAVLSLDNLLKATYLRSSAILSADEIYFSNNPGMKKEIERLQAINTPESPLLRLGTGQGFLSTTVGLNVRERDPELYDRAIREGVSFQRRWRTQQGNFPKTRRTVSDGQGRPLTVPGWIKLHIG
ncbi:MAG: type III-A CRISPR-associated RAMP protein Csm5 [Anaerolineae bacterium]|nr:type III-A CRISPR-associated RAMP protein Csm5 [Anaerolineae bacterium]